MGKIKEAIVLPTNSHNTLSAGTKIAGDIAAEEDFRIDGIVEGNIVCKKKIIVGSDSRITGDVECTNLELFGKIKGNVLCIENTILRASSTLTGDIKTATIEIEPGAILDGHCSMYKK